jgi:hypothetical protein
MQVNEENAEITIGLQLKFEIQALIAPVIFCS